MLSLPPSVRLFVATQPVDGRKGADSLMVLVRDVRYGTRIELTRDLDALAHA